MKATSTAQYLLVALELLLLSWTSLAVSTTIGRRYNTILRIISCMPSSSSSFGSSLITSAKKELPWRRELRISQRRACSHDGSTKAISGMAHAHMRGGASADDGEHLSLRPQRNTTTSSACAWGIRDPIKHSSNSTDAWVRKIAAPPFPSNPSKTPLKHSFYFLVKDICLYVGYRPSLYISAYVRVHACLSQSLYACVHIYARTA
jgi:hypothetical protein